MKRLTLLALLIVAGVILGLIDAFLRPILVVSNPTFSFIESLRNGLILGAIIGAGIIFVYAALFSPDSTIDKFQRTALFQSPDAVRRISYRFIFFLVGVAMLGLSFMIASKR